MRVLVAGATGALGRPLTARLRALGHEVFGVHRSAESADRLRAAGCTPLSGDVFDEAAVRRMVDAARKELSPRAMARAGRDTAELRRRTVPLFARAARDAGARFIAQSMCFVTRPEGPPVQDESAPLWLDGPRDLANTNQAISALEEATLGVGGLALRYGFFDGPGTWYARDGAIAALVRKRRFPLTGRGEGLSSFLHVDDAVEATVSAMTQGQSGAYNVCDGEPVAQRVWLPELARLLAAKPPLQLPAWVVGALAGPSAVYYGAALRGASNAKARRELSLAPRSWRAGFAEEFGPPS